MSHGSVATTSLLLEPSTQIFIPREPDRSRLGIKARNVFRFEISNQHISHDASPKYYVQHEGMAET